MVLLYSEDYYTSLVGDPSNHVKLTGSWESVYGEQDTFIHILEYDGFKGMDDTLRILRNSDVCETNLIFTSHST